MKNYYDENVLKSIDDDELWYAYGNQHGEELNIPAIDMIKQFGFFEFHIYCYKDDKGIVKRKEYFQRIVNNDNEVEDNV